MQITFTSWNSIYRDPYRKLPG